jgi:hypothetical protein
LLSLNGVPKNPNTTPALLVGVTVAEAWICAAPRLSFASALCDPVKSMLKTVAENRRRKRHCSHRIIDFECCKSKSFGPETAGGRCRMPRRIFLSIGHKRKQCGVRIAGDAGKQHRERNSDERPQ